FLILSMPFEKQNLNSSFAAFERGRSRPAKDKFSEGFADDLPVIKSKGRKLGNWKPGRLLRIVTSRYLAFGGHLSPEGNSNGPPSRITARSTKSPHLMQLLDLQTGFFF